ncbi:putative 1-phosphatidylinositol 3-phosphate 5-kinase isoform X2 [Spodoptera frugiperda]|uniref:1-phosphatidylinositol-3-phosphate 5-kinase n=1 Tax=Spodoptera frugiperda TaxID=7108 RepID=A0A9R0EV85_SPOFR|nr:putative 1-phosphatidylinositol 3-phosphate 5-kinase isoform X2 [Spodoptera frugiperda]
MDKYDTSQITEFPRYEPESSQSGVSTFFNKLWKFPLFSPSEAVDNMANKAIGDGKDAPHSEEQKQDYDDGKPETGTYAEELEGRSLPNVLRRISSLIALGSGGGTKYADTELARYWMPDDISRECYECASRFSTLRRRHHCRVCGQIFCSRCCSQRVPGHIFGCAGGLRVCNYCCNVVLSYLKENDMTGEIPPDLRTLQENLQGKFPENKSQQAHKLRDSFMFPREQEERCEPRPQHEALHDVYRHLLYSLPTQQHRYRLVRYNGVWRGCDVLQWVMDNTSNKTRAQATLFCQNLLCAGYMECMTELPQFVDYALYKPAVLPLRTTEDENSPEESTRLESASSSSYCLDLNLDESSARLTKTPKTEKKSSSSEEEPPVLEQNEAPTEARHTCKAIVESGSEHLRLLLRQCLARRALPAAWLHVLYPLCVQAADTIVLDVNSNDIDVRNYVQVKKVPGGTMRDSCLVQGVVLTKNVAHRGMPQQISNPTILLLDCSIAYQRVEGKLTSLEPVLLQEREYLVRCAARIAALRPRVVLVGGAAARGVQDALRRAGVALAAHVRGRALARAARASRASPLSSIDARVGMPRLGTCNNFYVKNYSSKTLMVLEGCAEPNLACCILLRGASLQELIKVKKVVKFMLLACYNWKLEKAFLGDIEAILPEPGMTFEDDVNENEVSKDDVVKDDITNDDTQNGEGEKEDGKRKDSLNEESRKSNETDSNESSRSDNIFVNSSVKETEKVEDKAVAPNNTNNEEKENKGSLGEDPLQTAKPFVRKTESDKTLSCGVPIRDFSDPLRATLSVDDDVFLPKEEAKLKADTHTDRWSTDDVVLSMSPNVVIPAPYLEPESGRRGGLRTVLPRPRAPAPPPHAPRPSKHDPRTSQSMPQLKELHPFAKMAITAPADDPALKAALAHYRATGCRLVNDKHKPHCPMYKPSVVKKVKEPEQDPNEKSNDNEPLDPLAPENHQQLSLLFYSFSNKSANVPDFCVNPRIVTMEMYGELDISLGAFLDNYCFNNDYKCTSPNCNVPMNQHVRRFVHGDVCITITCNTIGHSNVDKTKEESSKQVTFWSRCETCGWGGGGAGARVVSPRALCVSLAVYVRARVAAPRYVRAHCPHPLHAHTHAFVRDLTTVCFRYSKITPYEIQFPPDMISINYDTKQMRDNLIAQLNELVQKGHETFSGISEGEAEKDYQAFKQHMEQIHLALTSTSLQEHNTTAAVVRSLWSVSDRIISGEKMLREAQDKWSSPPTKNKAQTENAVEEKSELEDSSGDDSSKDNLGTTYVFADNSKETDKEHTGTEEDEEKGDKKTVRQILSQLLSNNQPANQSGMILWSGVVPVVVQAGDLGSVIAATLASVTYRRTRTAHRHNTQTDQEENENTSSTGKDKADGDKSKLKSNDHVEVLLKDGLVCRVYYAAQFQRLRHMVLRPLSDPSEAPAAAHSASASHRPSCACYDDTKDRADKGLCEIEEGFIRSLAHCVPWAARGGKSGSTFCKTKDDRYVLKEMTKPEWQQFLDFAPHYFAYVTHCRQNKLPSLLARILGVFGVGGAGSGVLVLEHVWYGAAPRATRFDLKGSSRHRLTPDTTPLAVLMDENLLNLRWENPLYVQSPTARTLFAAVERDTDFLAAHTVMDYSLLLGIDGHTLILGIIDYIRTFTWDKKLEHLVKKNLGSGQPTVVSPEQYKSRFCSAARKYFLQCPAHWDHLYTTIQE